MNALGGKVPLMILQLGTIRYSRSVSPVLKLSFVTHDVSPDLLQKFPVMLPRPNGCSECLQPALDALNVGAWFCYRRTGANRTV